MTPLCCICYWSYVTFAAENFNFYCTFAPVLLLSALTVSYYIMQMRFSKQINFNIIIICPDKNEAIDFHALYAGFLAIKMNYCDKNFLSNMEGALLSLSVALPFQPS